MGLTMSQSANQAVLRVPANLHGRRYLIVVDNTSVPLQGTSYEALLTLITRRMQSRSGNTFWHEIDDDRARVHQAVCRLKRDIDAALGSEMAAQLVQHTGRSVYRLGLDRRQVRIDSELPDLLADSIKPALLADLRRCVSPIPADR